MFVKHTGFTLIELMVALVVAGIGIALVIPSFSSSGKHSRLTKSANDLVSAIHVARSEAGKRGVPIVICRTSDYEAETPNCGEGQGWADGWIIYADDNRNGSLDADETIVQTGSAQPDEIFVKSHADLADTITFRPDGFAALPLSSDNNRAITFCDESGDAKYTRALLITNTGRPQVFSANKKSDVIHYDFPSCDNGGGS